LGLEGKPRSDAILERTNVIMSATGLKSKRLRSTVAVRTSGTMNAKHNFTVRDFESQQLKCDDSNKNARVTDKMNVDLGCIVLGCASHSHSTHRKNETNQTRRAHDFPLVDLHRDSASPA
jgi:hypothetical protein